MNCLVVIEVPSGMPNHYLRALLPQTTGLAAMRLAALRLDLRALLHQSAGTSPATPPH